MIRSDVHPLAKIKTVGIEALHAGIELEIVATLRTRLRDQPREQRPAVTARSLRGVGHEIVDVQIFSREKFVLIAVTRDGSHDSCILHAREVKVFALHLPDARDKIGGGKMRPQLLHHGKAARDVCIGFSDEDFHDSGRVLIAGCAVEGG